MHYRWLPELSLGNPIQQVVLQEYIDAERQAGERVKRLSDQIVSTEYNWKSG
jgi:transposase